MITPDRDVETATLTVGPVYSEVKRFSQGKLPAGVRERDTYLPKHSGDGNFSADEFRGFVVQAERLYDEMGRRRRLTGRVAEAAAVPEAPPPEDVDADAVDRMWLTVYASDGRGIGDELDLAAGAQQMIVGGKHFSMFTHDGRAVLCRGVLPEEVASVQRGLQVGAAVETREERDVRILPVTFDTAEERWRTVSEAVPDFEEVDFDDFPLQGPRTISHDTRQLRRLGLDFVQHHESWLKKSGVRASDRSVHEHSSVCRALNLMMCYDQLNMPAIAAAEALNRRRTLIEHAHQGRPDAPSYEGAEDFLGVRESSDGSIVDPALAAFAAKRQATKAEVMKQTRLAAEEKRLSKKGDSKGGKGKDDGGKAPEKP